MSLSVHKILMYCYQIYVIVIFHLFCIIFIATTVSFFFFFIFNIDYHDFHKFPIVHVHYMKLRDMGFKNIVHFSLR